MPRWDNKLLMNEGLYVEDINYINDIEYKYPIKCSIQVRHQHTPVNCTVEKLSNEYKVNSKSQLEQLHQVNQRYSMITKYV